MINCNLCKDTGIVMYEKTVNGNQYEFASHCTCRKGEKYKYDGTKIEDEKNRSNYYVTNIKDVDLDRCRLTHFQP